MGPARRRPVADHLKSADTMFAQNLAEPVAVIFPGRS